MSSNNTNTKWNINEEGTKSWIYVLGNIIVASLLYNTYHYEKHDYPHPKFFRKRLVVFHVLFQVQSKPCNTISHGLLQKQGHSWVYGEGWKMKYFQSIHLWRRWSSNGECRNLEKVVEKSPNVSSFIFPLLEDKHVFGGEDCDVPILVTDG